MIFDHRQQMGLWDKNNAVFFVSCFFELPLHFGELYCDLLHHVNVLSNSYVCISASIG
jgi:hypothetical protein